MNPFPDVIRSACCWFDIELSRFLLALTGTARPAVPARSSLNRADHIRPPRALADRPSDCDFGLSDGLAPQVWPPVWRATAPCGRGAGHAARACGRVPPSCA